MLPETRFVLATTFLSILDVCFLAVAVDVVDAVKAFLLVVRLTGQVYVVIDEYGSAVRRAESTIVSVAAPVIRLAVRMSFAGDQILRVVRG